MKTKLFVSIVAVISALSIVSAGVDCKDNDSTSTVPEDMYCDIVRDWPEYLC